MYFQIKLINPEGVIIAKWTKLVGEIFTANAHLGARISCHLVCLYHAFVLLTLATVLCDFFNATVR